MSSVQADNAAKHGLHVDVRRGNGSAMPLADGSFDFVVCMAAFKNFSNPISAINEMYRVLRPGGQASIFDLRKDASWQDIAAEVRSMQLSAWNALLTRFIFRHGLLRAAYTHEELDRMAGQSHFRCHEIISRGIGFELRLTKVS